MPDLIALTVFDLALHFVGQGVGDAIAEGYGLFSTGNASRPAIGKPLFQSHTYVPLIERRYGMNTRSTKLI